MAAAVRSHSRRPVSWGILFWILALGLAACAGGSSGLAVGDEAPDFSLPTATGDQISLDDYVGRQPVLLYFHMAMG